MKSLKLVLPRPGYPSKCKKQDLDPELGGFIYIYIKNKNEIRPGGVGRGGGLVEWVVEIR